MQLVESTRLARIAAILVAFVTLTAWFPHGLPVSGPISLNFATQTYSSACSTLSTCITDTRASAESCVDLSNNVTYVSSNVACITNAGIGVQSGATNLILQSQALNTSPWGTFTSGSGTSAAFNGTPVTSPDGTANAWAVTVNRPTAPADTAALLQNFSATAANYTGSIWLKACAGGDVGKVIDVVLSTNGVGTSDNIKYTLTSSWVQVAVPNFLLTVTGDDLWVGYVNTSTGNSQTGAVCFDAWQGQVELGASASVPIVTTTTTVTRAIDNISIIGPAATAMDGTAGTITVETLTAPVLAAGALVDSSGTAMLSKDSVGRASAGLVVPMLSNAVGWGTQIENVAGLAWDGTGRTLILNNFWTDKDSTAQIPSSTLHLGTQSGSSNACNCYIAALTAQPTRMSDGALGTATAPGAIVVGTTYYVSPTGSDSNNGTSSGTAWQTIAKVNAHTFGPGDKMLFDGGNGAFTGCLTPASTATRASPLTFDVYNGTAWSTTCTTSAGTGIAVAVSGLIINHWTGSGSSGTAQFGVRLNNNTSAPIDYIVVENSDISSFYATSTSLVGSEIEVDGLPGPQPIAIMNFQMLNNTLHGVSGVSSADQNGLWGYGNGENLYGLIARGNTVYNMAGQGSGSVNAGQANGIDIESWVVGLAEHNLVHDMGYANVQCGGPVAIWTSQADRITVRYNEAYNMKPGVFTSGCDWDGFDADLMTTNSVFEYNYSHNNWGTGTGVYVYSAAYPWNNVILRYNVSENDNQGGTQGFGCIGVDVIDTTNPTLNIYGNTCFNNTSYAGGANGYCLIMGEGNNWQGSYANNICGTPENIFSQWHPIQQSASGFSSSNIIWDYNSYYDTTNIASSGAERIVYNGTVYTTFAAYKTASGNDAHSLLQTSPGYAGTPPNGACTWTPSAATGPQPCPAAYNLAHGSAMIGAGVNLRGSPYNLDTGPRDYYGNVVPNGQTSGFNVGADNSTP